MTTSRRGAEQTVHECDTRLVVAETELRHATHSAATLEEERRAERGATERLREELRSVTQLNSALEQQLVSEHQTVGDNQSV